LCNCRITGEDPPPPPREALLYLESESLQQPVLIWHGSARSQGGSSKLDFLADVNEAQYYTPIVVMLIVDWIGTMTSEN